MHELYQLANLKVVLKRISIVVFHLIFRSETDLSEVERHPIRDIIDEIDDYETDEVFERRHERLPQRRYGVRRHQATDIRRFFTSVTYRASELYMYM